MDFQYKIDELFFVSFFSLIELDDSSLEDIKERVYALIIGLLLNSGGESRIDRHSDILCELIKAMRGCNQNMQLS